MHCMHVGSPEVVERPVLSNFTMVHVFNALLYTKNMFYFLRAEHFIFSRKENVSNTVQDKNIKCFAYQDRGGYITVNKNKKTPTRLNGEYIKYTSLIF